MIDILKRKEKEIVTNRNMTSTPWPDDKSTLSLGERKDIWDKIKRLTADVIELKGLVQNPMPLTHYDLANWSLEVKKLMDNLEKLQQDVVMLASANIMKVVAEFELK